MGSAHKSKRPKMQGYDDSMWAVFGQPDDHYSPKFCNIGEARAACVHEIFKEGSTDSSEQKQNENVVQWRDELFADALVKRIMAHDTKEKFHGFYSPHAMHNPIQEPP